MPPSDIPAAFDQLKDDIPAEANEIVEWLWNFGDGLTSTDQNPSHTYATPGTKTVLLTVTNDAGGRNTIHYDIVVPFP